MMSQKVIKKEVKEETNIDHVISINHHHYNEKSEDLIDIKDKSVIF